MTAIEASPPLCLKVALPVPMPGLFDYRLPDDDRGVQDWPGCRVCVPFGNRNLIGWVVAVGPSATPMAKMKPLIARVDDRSLLTPEALDTLLWTARYYQGPVGEVFSTAVPALLREGKALPESLETAWQLTETGYGEWPSLRTNSAVRRLASVISQGMRRESWLESIRKMMELYGG